MNRSLEQSLRCPHGGLPPGQFGPRVRLQRWSPLGVNKLEYAAGSCALPLRRRQFLPGKSILGPRDDAVRSVGDHGMPTWWQLICGDYARKGARIGRSNEGVAALALDLYRHDDADQKLFDDRTHE